MSKYVIEFDKEQLLEYDKDTDTYFRTLYKAKGFNTLVFDQFGLDKLTPLDKALSSELGEAYQKGFEAGQHEATTLEYQQGLNDAWETINKIASIPYAKRSEIFDGQQDILSIVQKFSPSEVIAKLKAYEEQQKADSEIKVGDEIESDDGKRACVLYPNNGGSQTFAVIASGKPEWWSQVAFHKTGRHFPQIAELLKAMKEGAE